MTDTPDDRDVEGVAVTRSSGAAASTGLRVALVYRNFSLSGSLERDTVLLAQGLAKLGVEVHCYCNPEARTIEPAGIRFHDVRPVLQSRSRVGYAVECGSFALAATAAVRRDRRGYDIVDVCGSSAWEQDVVTVHAVTKADRWRWAEEAAGVYGVPHLRARLAPAFRPQIAVVEAIERRQIRRRRFRRLIAVTPAIRDDLLRIHGVEPDVVDVIPPPVDVAPFLPTAGREQEARQSLGIRPGDHAILFVGHDFERKGLGEAIAAVSALPAETHLIVVGGGDEARFQRVAERLGVAGRVHFVGRTENPASFYRAADSFVLPTRHDPWGIPLIEAMAAGLPIVTAAAAGAAEVVRRAGTGLVLEDASARPLREALDSLLHDAGLRAAMAERGPAAAAPFDVVNHARRTVAVYELARIERSRVAEGALRESALQSAIASGPPTELARP